MNCQEVMELMQRQLDDDLSDEEYVDLNNHTRQCPDCAATFERLKRLSSELASLPKVTPRYSLVDAILPELERIESETQQAAPAAAEVTAERVSESRRLKRERKWPSWSAVGSVVAAGIVAGLFLLNAPDFGGGSKDDAGFSADMNTESAANAGAVEKMKLADIYAGGDLPAEDELKRFASETPESQSQQASGAKSAGSAEPVDKDERNGAIESTTDNQGDEAVTSNVIEEAQVAPTAAGDEDGEGGESTGFTGSEDGGETEGATAEPIVDNEDQSGADNKAAPDMGIAVATDFPSPDGKYIAHVDEYSIIITEVENGEIVMQTERKNGHHSGLAWSEDGTELNYEVHLDQGATEKYAISIPELTEKKASH